MIKQKSFRIALMLAGALAAGGCGTVFKKSKPKTPVLGERIAVLTSEGDIQVDPALGAVPMVLPQAVANPDWTQSGGNASKSADNNPKPSPAGGYT